MGKFNLSEAAKDILSGNVSSKQSMRGETGTKPEVGKDALHGDAAYGTKDAGDIGTRVTKTNDAGPDAHKGAPTATPPGATPPVSSEPMKHLDRKFNAQADGRKDLEDNEEAHEDDMEPIEKIETRKASKLAPQKMEKNKGATFDTYAEEAKHDDEEQDKALIRKMVKKSDLKEKMKEDMDALLGGESLSEEFISKATTIFEAAVIARAEEVIAEAENALQEQFESAVEEIKEDLASKVDDYLNYMVEEWMTENQIAIEKGLRAEIVEDFIGGLRNLFVEHYIDIPADKVDVVEQLTAKVTELEEMVNEQVNRGIELQKELNEQKKIEAIYTACEGLTQTQVEKLKSLAENVEFTTEEEFVAKLDTLKESYFKADVKVADSSALDDEVQIDEEVKPKQNVYADPSIEIYAKTISQSLAK